MVSKFQLKKQSAKPVVIAGPCMAESEATLNEVAQFLVSLSAELKFDLVIKGSFDKANRTSIKSDRGPGWAKVGQWFSTIREKHGMPVLTDIHETSQVEEVAAVCDVLQIPAFLCRQTDLLVAAVKTGRAVNIKKGQFLAPQDTKHIISKVREVCDLEGLPFNAALTERGTTFGYGNLIVDMRSFPIMAATEAAVIFDITHSLQFPGAGDGVSGGAREFAPVLARAATATGCLDGFFLEVHPDPKKAKSDAATQLSITQAESLLRQIIPLWYASQNLNANDYQYKD